MTHSDGRRSMGLLLRDLAEGASHLVRQEVRLASKEVTAAVGAVGAGTTQVATGGVLIVLGILALFIGVILLMGDQWLRDRYWLAALVVAVTIGGIALWLTRRGRAALVPERFIPDQTVATLEEDKEWLKRRLTSGATSR